MKRFLGLLFALLAGLFCFACGGNPAEEDPGGGGDPSGGNTEETLMTYDRYDPDAYLSPIWKGKVVYNETLLFLGKEDAAPLLYTPGEIISVRSYDLATEYREGVDYTVENGSIRLTENTTIPYFEESEYYPILPVQGSSFECGKPGKPFILFGEGDTFCSRQVAVTYRTKERWRGATPADASALYPGTLRKLRAGEPLKIVFYGDSITTGANSSGFLNLAPYADSFPGLVKKWLEKKYGSSVSLVNTAKGGENTQWGIDNAAARVTAYAPDLVVIGFGMNDVALSAQEHEEKMRALIGIVREGNPDAEILLVSPMLPNEEVLWAYRNQPDFEEKLVQIGAEKGIGVANVTTMHRAVLERKRYRDMTGNNVNHPNDFLARIYAQTILRTLVGEDFC